MPAGRVELNDPYAQARSKWIIIPLVLLVTGQLWLVRASLLAPLTVARSGGWTVDRMAWALVQCVIAGAVLVLLWRVIRVSRYRAVAGLPNHLLPEITVIVPAFNEGKQVYETLKSIVGGDYPGEKLHVVTVNDGSADDTWSWMERAVSDFGDQITAINCRVNRGKRAVLAEGFARAHGTVLVTVDSDSMIGTDTLRNLVSPFIVDPRVGAVAGNVRVLNQTGFIPRMMDVSFTYAFELIRASESVVDTVTCCPGALSAYRRDLVDRIVEPWLHQTFLGVPAKIGEDRAMTNFILRMGYLVKFQSNAIVRTDVPRKLPNLSRMLLRWGRSNIRETIELGTFIFTRFRSGSTAGARIDFTWVSIQMVARVVTYPMFIALVITRPNVIPWMAMAFMASAVLPAAVYALIRGGERSRAAWAFVYALYSPVFLSWIAPYALLTVRQSAWLTRGKPASVPALAQNEDTEVPVLARAESPMELSA